MDGLSLFGSDGGNQTCLFCSGTVLDSKNTSKTHKQAMMVSIPRLLKFDAPPDLVRGISTASACSVCFASVEEGHGLLLQLDNIQNKMDEISTLLKIKIMEGRVRQSSLAHQHYSEIGNFTDKMRKSLAKSLDLDSVVGNLVLPKSSFLATNHSNDSEVLQEYNVSACLEPCSLYDEDDFTLDTSVSPAFVNSPLGVTEVKDESDDGIPESETVDDDHENVKDNDLPVKPRKKKRNPFFDPNEVRSLVTEYLKQKATSKFIHGSTWEKIAKIVSTRSSSGVERTAQQCQDKIKNLKKTHDLSELFNSEDFELEVDDGSLGVEYTSTQDDETAVPEPVLPAYKKSKKENESERRGKTRMPFFQPDEVSILVNEYTKYRDTFLGSNPFKKSWAWKNIAKAVSTHSISKVHRSAGHCQSKIKNMKKTGFFDLVKDDSYFSYTPQTGFALHEHDVNNGADDDDEPFNLAYRNMDDPEPSKREVIAPNGTFELKTMKLQLVRCDHRSSVPAPSLSLHKRINVLKLRQMMKRQKNILNTQKQARANTRSKQRPAIRIYNCSKCSSKFSMRRLLKRHEAVTHRKPKPCRTLPVYSCPAEECDKKFSTIKPFEKHLELDHSSELKYFCDHENTEGTCGTGFFTSVGLEQHKRRFHDPSFQKVPCNICHRSFFSELILRNHMRNHTKGPQFLCESCTETFSSKVALESHRAKTHGETFVCPECKYACPNNSALKRHMMMNHSAEGRAKILKYPCAFPECSLKFVSPSMVRHHVEGCHSGGVKNFQCDKCATNFVSLLSLKRHVKIHTGENQRKCSYCSKILADPKSLKNHVKLFHEKTAEINCEGCGKGFPLRKYYLAHRSRCSFVTKVHK